MNSTSIPEIENYLSKAHPEDPKKIILHKRLIELKNEAWVKGRADAKPMAARPIVTDIRVDKNNKETEELYKKILQQTSEEQKQKTVKLLNALFDQSTNKNEAIILVKNNSDCNMVLQITGKKNYQLAVPTKGENTIVIDKGTYNFDGKLCTMTYKKSKEITNSIAIILGDSNQNKIATKTEALPFKDTSKTSF